MSKISRLFILYWKAHWLNLRFHFTKDINQKIQIDYQMGLIENELNTLFK